MSVIHPDLVKSEAAVNLLKAAKKLFANNGFSATTVKDLADEANVNVSLVSYYFGSKDGLYKATLHSFAEERVSSMVRLLEPAQNETEFQLRLKLFAEEIIDVHLREPDLCLLIHRDIDLGQPIAIEVFEQVFLKLFESFCKFLKHAEQLKIINTYTNVETLAALIFGSLLDFVKSEKKRCRIGKPSLTDEKYRREFVETWLQLTWSGLGNRK